MDRAEFSSITPNETPDSDGNEALFGISNDELNKIFYTISEYVDMIDLKDKEINDVLIEISKTEELVKNYLKELTMLNKFRRRDLKVIFYDILNEKFNTYDKSKNVRQMVKREYESLFERKNVDLKKEIEIFFQNQKLDKKGLSNLEIVNEVYQINKLKLLTNMLIELDVGSFPSFLIQQYKPSILQKIRRICKEMFDIEYYTYEISNKLEYDVLKNYFNKIITSSLSLFDEKFFNVGQRKILLKLLIIANIEYISLNKFSHNVLLQKLRNYIISFKLFDDEDDIEKKEDEMKKFIEVSLENSININETQIKEWFITLEKDLYSEKYLYLILCYSIVLNNLANIKIIDNKISLEFSEFTCSSRERVFLMNLLRRFQKDFCNDITRNYDTMKVNFNIENFIFLSLTKINCQNLFDEDFNKKIVLTDDSLFSSIRTTKSNYLKKEFELFTKNMKITKGLADKVKSEVTDFLLNLLVIENKEHKVDLDSLKIVSYDNKFLSNHIYIFVSGFTSQGEDNEKAWEGFLLDYSNYVDFYFYNWESRSKGQMVIDVAKFIGQAALTYYLNKKDFLILLSNLNRYRTNTNLFIKTRKTAKLFGELLAYIIASRTIFKHQSVSLVGFSLGCHVIKHCLKTLYRFYQNGEISANDIVKNVVFIAGATTFKNIEKWGERFDLIAGKIVNCYGEFDNILKYLYTLSTNQDPIGLKPIELKKKVHNFDFSDLELDHSEYRKQFREILSRLRLFD